MFLSVNEQTYDRPLWDELFEADQPYFARSQWKCLILLIYMNPQIIFLSCMHIFSISLFCTHITCIQYNARVFVKERSSY